MVGYPIVLAVMTAVGVGDAGLVQEETLAV